MTDISDNRVIGSILAEVGLNETRFFESINKADYKQKLRRNTDELMPRGGFGSPTFFIDDTDMYFGNDRLQLIELKLKGATS